MCTEPFYTQEQCGHNSSSLDLVMVQRWRSFTVSLTVIPFLRAMVELKVVYNCSTDLDQYLALGIPSHLVSDEGKITIELKEESFHQYLYNLCITVSGKQYMYLLEITCTECHLPVFNYLPAS